MERIKDSSLTFRNQTIYLGLDVHLLQWKVAIYTEDYEHKVFSQPSNPEVLHQYLVKHFPGARYESVYEAGFCGFWIHERLLELGIINIVVNPLDIPSIDKDRRRKTDARDARKLAKMLRSGHLTGIYCPSRSFQEIRSLVRRRSQLVKSQTRCKNQIKSWLHFYGIELEPRWKQSRWSGAFLKWLSELAFQGIEGKQTMAYLLAELQSFRRLMSEINKALRALSKEAPYQETLSYLVSVPGVGLTSAWVLYSELMDIERFGQLDQLHSYCGLVPDVSASADRLSVKGITKRGNRHLRNVLIECAWVAIRMDPILQKAYKKYCQRMKAQQAIIRIAKKLLNRIKVVWTNRCEYQINHTPNQTSDDQAGKKVDKKNNR